MAETGASLAACGTRFRRGRWPDRGDGRCAARLGRLHRRACTEDRATSMRRVPMLLLAILLLGLPAAARCTRRRPARPTGRRCRWPITSRTTPARPGLRAPRSAQVLTQGGRRSAICAASPAVAEALRQAPSDRADSIQYQGAATTAADSHDLVVHSTRVGATGWSPSWAGVPRPGTKPAVLAGRSTTAAMPRLVELSGACGATGAWIARAERGYRTGLCRAGNADRTGAQVGAIGAMRHARWRAHRSRYQPGRCSCSASCRDGGADWTLIFMAASAPRWTGTMRRSDGRVASAMRGGSMPTR